MALASPASATLLFDGDLNFGTTAQSMWGSGLAPNLDESVFVGTEWSTPSAQLGGFIGDVVTTPAVDPILITPAIPRTLITPAVPRKLISKKKKICVFGKCVTIPAVYTPAIPAVYSPAIPAVYSPAIPAVTIDTTTGAQVEASTAGKVGLNFSVKADSGSVNADVTFDAKLDVPDQIDPLTLFSLAGTSSVASGSTFDTAFPNLEAKAEFVLGVKADLKGKVCSVGNCVSDSTTIGFVDSNGNLDPAVIELISVNDGGSGKISILEYFEPAAFNFGSPISVSTPTGVEVGNVTVFLPDLETDGVVSGDSLSSSGETDVLELKLDLDGIAQAAAGLPPVLGAGANFGPVSFSYDLLDVEFGPILEIIQDFELDPTLMVDLSFSEAVLVEGNGQKQNFLSVAFDEIPQIALDVNQTVEVTPTFWVDADFSNTTRLGLDAEFTLDVLKASFALEALGLSYDLGELGPLFEYVKRFDVADLPALFNKNFSLGGFEKIVGDVFTLSTVSADPFTPVLENGVAFMQTGSWVELSQEIAAPTDASFTFSFDYQFLTDTGTLDVFIGTELIASIASPGIMSDFATFSIDLDTLDIFNGDLTALLRFVFDGPTGSVILLDNIEMTGTTIENGDFDLAALTNTLTGWTVTSESANGIAGAVVLESVPVPPTLWLMLGVSMLLLFGFNGLRRQTEPQAISLAV
jgi:hypothetical protein